MTDLLGQDHGEKRVTLHKSGAAPRILGSSNDSCLLLRHSANGVVPLGRQPFQSLRGTKPWGYSKADPERAVQLSVCPRVGTGNVFADGGSLGDLSPPWC